MIRLFTTIFPVGDSKRREEYRSALWRNVALGMFEEIYLLAEGAACPGVDSEKIRCIPIGARPCFEDFFSLANELAGPEDISVVANSDIYFDRSIGAVPDFLRPQECYCLSRWELDRRGRFRPIGRNDSQDVWIFRGPISEDLVAKFPIGSPRCDNRILYELLKAGYRVRNPAFSIRTFHLHAGMRGEYGEDGEDFVTPPFAYLHPHNLRPLGESVLYRLRDPGADLGWRFDLRMYRALPGWAVRRCARLFR